MTGNRSTQQLPNLIVGREREQRQLRSALVRSLDGLVSLALVSGEAGIGKSTLVDELRRTAGGEGCLVLAGGCYELETTPPYGPWAEIARAYPDDGELPDLPDELRPGGGMEGVDSQPALFDLASRFFAEISSRRPLILILEDVHWADPASLDLLRYLARSRSQSPLLIVATYRDEEISEQDHLFSLLPALVRESQATRIELQRLSAEDVTDLVARRYRLAPDSQDRLVDYLCRLAEGNPFFITELLHTLEEHGTLTPTAGGWRLGDLDATGVPVLVQQVIARRMASLDRPARIVLDIAAVAGADATLDLLESLQAGVDADLDMLLQQAIDHRLLVLYPDGRRIRFSHALVRQAVYESIPPLRRRSLHRQIGELLAGRARPDPDRAAHHFYQAGDERALDWLIRAAEQAQSFFAPETVIIRCRQAIDLANQLEAEPPLAIYRLQGLALETVGDFDGALETHETALNLARQQENRRSDWRALLDLAELWASRDYHRSEDYCARAVERARMMDDHAALGHSLNRLGNWQMNAGQVEAGIQNHREALEVFEEANDLHGRALTLDLLGIAMQIAGDTPTSLRYYEQAIPLLRRVDDRRTLASALSSAGASASGVALPSGTKLGDLPPSLGSSPMDLIREAADIAQVAGWQSGLTYTMHLSGHGAMRLGDARSGLEQLHEAVRIASEIDHKQWYVSANLHLARAYLYLRSPAHCLAHVRTVEFALSELASNLWQNIANGLAASAYIEQGDFDAARKVLPDWDEVAGQSSRPIFWAGWFSSAELALANDEYEFALEIIDRLIYLSAGTSGHLYPEISWLKGLALLATGRHKEAEVALLEASEVSERFSFKIFRWRVHGALRRLYLAQGRSDEADSAGCKALAIVDEIGDQLDDEKVQSAFLASARAEVPGDPPYAIARSSEGIFGGLTPREIEVLQLVARGMTNDEVSEQLFISPRTVGQHLRSIYNKLDVTNRTAASRIATEAGLLV